MGGVSASGASSAIHYGPPQCYGRLSIPTQPDLGVGVDPESRGLSRSAEAVAGVHRPLCHLTQLPMLPIFFFVPQSERSGHGCSAPEMGWVAGVCLSFLVTHSGSPQKLRSPDHRSSVLATEAMVPGSSGLGSGLSGGSATVAQSSATTALLSSSSGSVRAVASCLETIHRFARSQGFPKHVAKQSALAQRSSSQAGYQAKWFIYRQWCRSEGHAISHPSLLKIADFLFWLLRSKELSISAVLGYRSMLSLVFDHTYYPRSHAFI